MLTLYFSPGSSSMAVHIALHEIGVVFESRLVSLAKREQFAPEYLALNSEGKVPTLMIEGQPLLEANFLDLRAGRAEGTLGVPSPSWVPPLVNLGRAKRVSQLEEYRAGS